MLLRPSVRSFPCVVLPSQPSSSDLATADQAQLDAILLEEDRQDEADAFELRDIEKS